MKKKIIIVLISVFVLIQFFRPVKNLSTAKSPTDIATVYPMPDEVSTILNKACKDCHKKFLMQKKNID